MHHFPRKEQFDSFALGEVKPGGWMKQQMLDDLDHGFAGRLDEMSKRASSRAFTQSHTTSAEATEASMGEDTPRSWWDGETQAVWWDGLVRMAYLAGNAPAMAKCDGIMAELLQSQDESGYIGIYSKKFRYRHTTENGEFWTQSRAFVAMLAYYELTGKEAYLQAVEKAMALTMREYGPHRTYFGNAKPAGGTCHGLMLVDVCEWLYRITGKEAYRAYGIWCYEDYCRTREVRDTDNQLEHLLLLHEGFVWHTPHTTEHLRVPLWAWFVSGRPHYRKGAENAFDKIGRYLTPSGACIGSESIKNLPPLPEMTYEYCAITELLTSLQSAGQKTGLAEMGDMAEWLAFNAAQGARLADGKAINYMSMDNRHAATLEGNGGRRKFSPTHEDIAVCCNPNAVKLLPYYVSKMWFRLRDGAGICAFCYGPSELRTTVNGVPVTVTEETDYPFSEQIVFEVKPARPVEFEFRFRIPGWAATCDLNAGDDEPKRVDNFYCIRKTWQTGDRIVLSLGCDVEPVVACNGEAGIRRGPLLYALSIAGEKKILKEYDVTGFADIAVTPAEEIPDYHIDAEKLNFVKQSLPDGDCLRPWHASPVAVSGTAANSNGAEETIRLVPFGCTVLRQTTFKTDSKLIT
jgi:uncharacterized protein